MVSSGKEKEKAKLKAKLNDFGIAGVNQDLANKYVLEFERANQKINNVDRSSRSIYSVLAESCQGCQE